MVVFIALLISVVVALLSLLASIYVGWRPWAWPLTMLSVLVSLALASWVYLPRSYTRGYESESRRTLLAEAIRQRFQISQVDASLKGIHVGAAVRSTNQLYRSTTERLFTSVTPENALKLGSVLKHLPSNALTDELIYDFSAADIIVDEALAKGLRVRGHALVFGKLSDQFKSPDLERWLQRFPESERKAQLQALMQKHIETVIHHYKGRIDQWDVVNEVMQLFGRGDMEQNVFYRHLGAGYIAWALGVARGADPELKLYLNEQFNSYDDSRAQAFIQLVANLKQSGVPLDGVGIQGHHLFDTPSINSLQYFMESLANLGVTIEITELEARLRIFGSAADPYVAQGEHYRDVVKACLDVSACTGVTFWGYNDSISWMDELWFLFPKPNEAYLLDAKNREKPAVELIYRLFE